MILEICAASIESGLNAQIGGADRIELCVNLEVGGLTPSHGMVQVAKDLIEIPIYVLIRPRPGNFCYSSMEYEVIKEDILCCKSVGCHGVVIGLLTKERYIREDWLARLVELAYPMEVTFHRAFDEVKNPFEALDILKETGVKRVLTAGLASHAWEGKQVLGELVEEAGDEIVIMPGGGVRPNNLVDLMETGALDYHSSALVGNTSPLQEPVADLQTIKEMKSILTR